MGSVQSSASLHWHCRCRYNRPQQIINGFGWARPWWWQALELCSHTLAAAMINMI